MCPSHIFILLTNLRQSQETVKLIFSGVGG